MILCVSCLLTFSPITVLLMPGITDKEATAVMAADQDPVAAPVIRPKEFRGRILRKDPCECIPGNVKYGIHIGSKHDFPSLGIDLKPQEIVRDAVYQRKANFDLIEFVFHYSLYSSSY